MRRSEVGTWRIVEMELWDLDAIELVGPALFEVQADGLGRFSFIAVQGGLDWKPDDDALDERIAFSWEGDDEGDPVSGRGWAKVDDGQLVGRVFFHLGDDSAFRAVRIAAASRS